MIIPCRAHVLGKVVFAERNAVILAHNYQRDHPMNMWFVLATESAEELERTIREIGRDTGLEVFNFPKQEEFYVGLHFQV